MRGRPWVADALSAYVWQHAAEGKLLPKNQAIADALGCNEWSVRRHLNRMHDAGTLVLENAGSWKRRVVT